MFASALLTTLLLNPAGEITPIGPDVSEAAARKRSRTPLPIADAITGIDSHLEAPLQMRITDESTWRRIWYEHHNIQTIRGRIPHPLPEVDFSRFMVLGLVEEPETFPNGVKIARVEVDQLPVKRRGIEVVWVDYHSPGKTERFESGAQKNVFGFFVIPRYEPQLILRRNTQNGWKEVKRFHALPPGSGVTITVGPQTASPITGTVIAATPPSGLVRSGAINIGFAFDPGQGRYDGVVGSPGDVWNFVDIGTTAVDYLRHPDASGSSARLRITRHDGEWAVKTDNQIFRGYIYHNCQCVDLEATLVDVAPGRYRAYVYAHGDAPNQNASIQLLVGDRSIGEKATAKDNSWDFQSSELKEGLQYVTFDFDVAAQDDIRIISHRDGSGYSMLNAIQLVPLPATAVSQSEERHSNLSVAPPQPAESSTADVRVNAAPESVFLDGIHTFREQQGIVREAWLQVRVPNRSRHRIRPGQDFQINGRAASVDTIGDQSILLRLGTDKLVWRLGERLADCVRQPDSAESDFEAAQ